MPKKACNESYIVKNGITYIIAKIKSIVIPFSEEFFLSRILTYFLNKKQKATTLKIPKIMLDIKDSDLTAISPKTMQEIAIKAQYKPKAITIDNSKQIPLVLCVQCLCTKSRKNMQNKALAIINTPNIISITFIRLRIISI